MENTKFEQIVLENTNFIYTVNLSGDPARDNYGSSLRNVNIIIPNKDLALEMIDLGLAVKFKRPTEPDGEGYYFIKTIAKYKTDGAKYDPKIYLVADNGPVLLDSESLGVIDEAYIKNVNAVITPWFDKRRGRINAYIDVMYVEIDGERKSSRDPFANRYR